MAPIRGVVLEAWVPECHHSATPLPPAASSMEAAGSGGVLLIGWAMALGYTGDGPFSQ